MSISMKKILLVEDEALIAMSEKSMLLKFGYDVQTVDSGERAVDYMESHSDIDLVLMDIDLGDGIDGTEAARQILRGRDVPLLFLSSHTEPEIVEKTESITNYGYVVKSSSFTVLDASIKMAFKLFEAMKRIDEERMKNEASWEEMQVANDNLIRNQNELVETENALRASEELLKHIDDASIDSIYSYDRQGRFTHANRALCKLLGLRPDQIIGKTHEELGFPTAQCEAWRTLHNRVYETDSTVVSGTETPIQGGTSQYFEVVLNPIHDESGQIIGISGSTRDVTNRKMSENVLEAKIEKLTSPETNDTQISILDLFELAELQEIQDSFSSATGVASLITKPDGVPITKPSNFTRFCNDFVRSNSIGRSNCKKSDAILGQVSQSGPTIAPCHSAGLLDAGASISVGGEHIANWLIGQIRDEGRSDEAIRKYANAIGCSQEAFVQAYHEVPVVDKEKFEKIANLLFRIANQLSASAYNNLRQARLIHELEQQKTNSENCHRRQDYLIQASMDGYWAVDKRGRITEASEPFCKMVGYGLSELLSMTIGDLDTNEAPEEIEKHITTIAEKGFDRFESTYRRKDGSLINVELSVLSIPEEDGAFVAFVRDINEQQVSINRYKMLFDRLPVGMALINHKTGAFLDANQSLLSATGYSKQELLRMTFWDITPEEYKKQEEVQFQELNDTEMFTTREKEYIRKDGTRYPIALSGAKYTDKNGTEVVWGIIEDITERTRSSQKIESLLAEKELILREVHHRIKNNMNTIGSLLALQSQGLTEPTAIAALSDMAQRIRSMGVLYDKLYRSGGFTTLSLSEYLPTLAEEIVRQFPNSEIVKIRVNIEPIMVDTKKLQTIGIILNELLVNAMKYAFAGRSQGIIEIMSRGNAGRFFLSVHDDGVGIPEGVSFENSTGFGMQLIYGLTQQMDGKISIERDKGTKVVLECNM